MKVLDFGLAKLFDPSQSALKAETLTQSVDEPHLVGTLPYMAPEQVNGDRMDARTDIYALGVVLYEMATRQRPFREDSTPGLFDSILHQPVVPPRALNPRISPEMERIILKCLEKEPESRYQSAKELEVDLRRLITPSSTAVPITTVRRARIWWWRTGVAVAVVAVVSIGFMFLHSRKAAALTERDTVLLADFTNTTGEPAFDGTLKQAAAVQLGQSPFLSLVAERQVRETLRFMGRSPDERHR